MKSKLSPNAVICWFLLLLLVMTVGSTVLALNGVTIELNETQVMYLYSTSAQVISTIFGLTLTGYIFFRTELSREKSDDETLIEVVENLKSRYFRLLLFITVLVCITLILANLEISYEAFGEPALNTAIMNTGHAFFFTSLMAIAYFIFDVIAPDRIERASKSLQNKYDPTVKPETQGSLEEFLKNYNEIENLLQKFGSIFQESQGDPRYRRRIPNTRLAEILFQEERIDKKLYSQLRELITLRNSIIHGANPMVSQSIVEASINALKQLKYALLQE